ncbi:MAG: NAD-dependent epimerase/dehydratase family protein [Gallionellaceae bacterium]|nr:NAD-dependent epimerase/dehydratase family protein [Gallionellaceae bacterium]
MAAIHATRQDWQRFAGKRVLITGASGFLAAYLVEFFSWLNEQGQQEPVAICALGRDLGRLRGRFPHLSGRADFVPLVQDVCAPMSGIGQVDFIVHAASPASPRHYLHDPVGTARANTLGTLNVLDLARAAGARLLFLSSGTVYGQGAGTRPIAETDFGPQDPLDPRACYSEGKRMGEALCAAYARQYGVPTGIARISHTYGPGVALDDGRVFADFVADVLAGRDISLTGDGMDSRPFCYVADATAAFLAVLLQGESGAAYNVGMDSEMTILELAELLARLAPRQGTQVILPTKGKEVRANVRSNGHFDIAKIGHLNWRSTTSPAVGFERTLRYFLSV